MNKILLVGPICPPIHGQSLAFTRFVESIKDDNKIVINTNLEDKSKLKKLFYTFKTLCIIFFKALFLKYNVVYFTCSRSFLGSVKDVLLINLVSLKKIKIINHLHGSDFDEFIENSPKWYKKILLYSYNKIDISIVLLDEMKPQFKKFPNMKVEVVPNFYDKELDKKLASKDSDKINLVYLSNIMSSKGIFELIEAFKELSKTYDNLYLNIAGGYIADEYMSINEIKNKFENKISNNNRIKYIGKTFGEEKIKLLQKSDIFVLPSYKEAVPLSILEAMACSNAVVSTYCKYLPNIISEKNGVLVKIKSVESLTNGIESLLKDKGKLEIIQKYNQLDAKKKYSSDKYIENLNKIVFGEQS